MNKFEHVRGREAGLGWGGSPNSEVQGLGGGALCGEVQCIMVSGHMGTPFPWWRDWWTDTTKNITFPQLRLAGGKNATNIFILDPVVLNIKYKSTHNAYGHGLVKF